MMYRMYDVICDLNHGRSHLRVILCETYPFAGEFKGIAPSGVL